MDDGRAMERRYDNDLTAVSSECPTLPKIAHGIASTSDKTIGSVVVFECKSDYTMVGPKNLTCQWNGEWNRRPPLCIRKYFNEVKV